MEVRTARTTAVVPTVGKSRWLADCLRDLRAQDGAGGIEIVVVAQAVPDEIAAELRPLADRWLDEPLPVGFAVAVNRGWEGARGEYLAVVNDDARVARGWLAALTAALDRQPRAAAAQGVNLRGAAGDDEGDREVRAGGEIVDGWGLAWNRWWQAVQLGRGERPPRTGRPPEIVFGVSATAALYRAAALREVARGEARPFDPRLGSYYEDVELAGRLHAAGFVALSVPAARARHLGSASLGAARGPLVQGNRYLAAAALLGRDFWRRLPRMVARDLIDLGRAAARGELRALAAIAAGWARAARRLPVFAHRGEPVPVRFSGTGKPR